MVPPALVAGDANCIARLPTIAKLVSSVSIEWVSSCDKQTYQRIQRFLAFWVYACGKACWLELDNGNTTYICMQCASVQGELAEPGIATK